MNSTFTLVCIGLITAATSLSGQTVKVQFGGLVEDETNSRLPNITVRNKRTAETVRSSGLGLFEIVSLPGDTLIVSDEIHESQKIIVSDYTFVKLRLKPVLVLKEVVIRGKSLQSNLNEIQSSFRSQGVFYTGTPHYYYLFLKPMTFIYENFKSEVKHARKFKKYARAELEHNKIARRFNDPLIKSLIPINDKELLAYKTAYFPTAKQIDHWNDYELSQYIIKSYHDFKANPFSFIK